MTNPRLDDVNAERIEWNELAVKKGKMACWDGPDYADFQKQHVDRIRDGLTGALGSGNLILDLGAGVGRITVPMARRFPFVFFVASDISKEMLRKMTKLPNIALDLADGRTLREVPLAGAYSMLLFQHLPALAVHQYILAVGKNLRPSGPFVFQYVEGHNDTFLAHDFTEPIVSNWCVSAGLKVAKIEADTTPGYEAWRWVYARKP